MTTSPDRARTRVVCKIFIKATPQAVGDAINPALTPSGGLARWDGSGPVASSRSGLVSVEVRDTLTGYTAVTVSREPDEAPGRAASGSVSAHAWERLLGDLKTVLEADGRKRQRAGSRAGVINLAATARLTGASFAWGRGANVAAPVAGDAGRAQTAGGAGRAQTRSQPERRAQRP
jgi:hypothetical protein